ncbi:MAG: hypothetical protein JWR69_466 [Pedosphaera sp.]|nr:hypothetical protein [Pedosphaera sp.]
MTGLIVYRVDRELACITGGRTTRKRTLAGLNKKHSSSAKPECDLLEHLLFERG